MTATEVLRYRYGFAAQKKDKDKDVLIVEPEHIVYTALRVGLQAMLKDTGATDYTVYLSGRGNFRHEIDPEYKANRKDFEKPYHYDNITQYLLQCHDALIINGVEADDAMAVEQLRDLEGSVICTIDKDLDQIEGWHYNFVTKKLYYVTEDEGWYNFYIQMLTGDTVDNIKGIYGKGPKKAEKLLEPCTCRQDMAEVCKAAYVKHFEERADIEWEKNWRLLFMLRTPEDLGIYSQYV